MVPSLLPHLPGLDPQALYVISGPFPQQEEAGGAVEELVENTTVIAVNVTDDTMLRPGDPVSRCDTRR